MLIELDGPGSTLNSEASAHALAAGTQLAEFELLSLLGEGGFGIVYLAFDHSLQREVAIKEYLPKGLARRGVGLRVQSRGEEHDAHFELGLKSFVTEARTLAQFDHPALLKVYRFWEANGTAYMATPLYRGQTLQAYRRSLGRAPTDGEVRAVMLPLLQALQVLHAQEVLHGDVAPDNILIDTQGRPVLLDFGAARQVLRSGGDADAAMLKPAYAALERQVACGPQGPWTDLYSLGASLYYMLMGAAPPRATVRATHDMLRPLPAAVLRDCDPTLLHEIDQLLTLRPQGRSASAQAVWERLSALPQVAEVPAARAMAPDFLPTTALASAVVTVQEWEVTGNQALDPTPMPAWPENGVARRAPLWAAVVVVALAMAGAWWAMTWSTQAPANTWSVGAVAAREAPATTSASPVAALPAASTPVWVGAAAATPLVLPAAAPVATARRPAPAMVALPPLLNGRAAALPTPTQAPGRTGTSPEVAAAAHPSGTASAAPASATDPAAATSPRAACSQEAFLFREVCMERQCGKSEWRGHAQCVQMRELQEAAQRNREGG